MSERQSKSTQDRHERILNEIVKNPGNENCADCGSKNPRWASYSLGVFLCIRCAGIHRKMGTHISKVKSITMDQWNMEQIEMMRKSGGNIAVNSRINPNPGNNPLPLASDDEHVMERYIRAKWEKRSFMTDNRIATPPKNPITRLQVLPKRSSSVPTITQDPLVIGLNKLRDLGYKDEVKNKQVLIQTQGNLDAAIEILTRNASTPQPATITTTPLFLSDGQKIEQLMRLGFTDRNSNLDALRRSGGNLDIAITILNETKSILQQQNGIAGQIVQPTQQQQPLNFRSNSVPVTSVNNNNFLIDVDNTMNSNTNNIFSNPFGINTQQQLFQQQQQQQMLQHQQMLQQQQFMLQQQQQQQNTMFSNPFGLTTTPSTTVFNSNPQAVTTPSSNPFSQMTASPYTTTNNNSYFQPTSLQQQQPQQQQQMNPWSSNTLF